MKIKDIPINERPRERLERYGVSNISNEELLAIIIKNGSKNNSARDISLEILKRCHNLNDLNNINLQTFKDIKGLGRVKSIELVASIELGRRISLNKINDDNIRYNSSKLIYLDNRNLFQNLKQEYFYCLYLDCKNKLIERKLLFMGTINRSIVHPREVFKEAYLLSASNIVCLHNHPSGDINPSREDIVLTKSLVEIGKINGINIIDHLIIGNSNYYSFYDEGMI